MKHSKRSVGFIAVLAAIACVLAMPALAEEPGDEDAGISPYAISRLKVLAGQAWMKSTDTGDWVEATTNTPLTPNSRISVPEGSEAELQFHGGQFVLLTAGTDVEVREMAEDKTYFRLRAGEIRFDLPGDDFAPVTVRVPGGARAQFTEPGKYWLTVTDEDTTRLVVRRGKATASQEGEKYRLDAGQEAEIGRDITVRMSRAGVDTAPPPESLSEEERRAGVPPVVNYELREYGEWVTVPSYGMVWRPRVAGGWAPHVYGRWDWVSPYGWTWVSYEPWGWYPYHSGYWVNDMTFGWVWSPYGSFVSIGFVWGSYDYYHHHYDNHYYHPHRNYRYHHSNARFVPEGRGGVRWEPMRPGERYRRPEMRRDDARLRSFNRPLESGRVFAAPRPAAGTGQRQWRDVNTVRTERQQAVRSAPTGGPRKDVRPVRPEMTRQAPSGAQRPSGMRSVAPATRQGSPATRQGSPAVTTPRGTTPTQRVSPQKNGAPAQRVAPQPQTAPSPQVAPQRNSTPAPRVAPQPQTAPSPRVAPQRNNTPAPRVAPQRESAPVRSIERAPSSQGVERSNGGGVRSGGGNGGGGDRSGGGSRETR